MKDRTLSNTDQSAQQETEALVDQLLLDALLQGRYQDTPETTLMHVERAWQRHLAFQRIRLWRWGAGFISAAAAVLVLGLMMILSSPQNVQANLDPILAAFDQGDKTYRIEISSDSNHPTHKPHFGRRRFGHGPRFRSPRHGMKARILDGASLYTRGHNYVLTCRGPRGTTLTKGFDGKEKWFITPSGQSLRGSMQTDL
ncbi:MAG: hypothetical protein MI922_18540, partial [Bacteroidales bacterium]|nr:hypothetical protein [Bacteroidales bacterium]